MVERMERLAADAELIGRLQFINFDVRSPEWQEVSYVCAGYGYGVFVGWSHAGLLRPMAQRHGSRGAYGYTKLPEGLQLVGDDAHELSAELMIQSIEAFRTKTLMNPDPSKRWRSDGGASLRTFFIGRSLMELPDVYTRWHGNRSRSRKSLPEDVEHWKDSAVDFRYQRDTIPHERAIAVATLDELEGDSLTMAMFRLQDEGYSYAEIAEMLADAGIPATVGSVRSSMSRFRKRVRRERGPTHWSDGTTER